MDRVVKFCIAMFNIIIVTLIMSRAEMAGTLGEKFLRGVLVVGYFVTLILLSKGACDENNNKPNDDV